MGGEGTGRSAAFTSAKEFKKGDRVGLRFSNGNIELLNSPDRKLHWSCKRFRGEIPSALVQSELGETLDLTGPAFLKCEIGLPEGVELGARGSNGRLALERPRFSVKAELANGKVDMDRDPSVKYAFEVSVVNGSADQPESAESPDFRIELGLTNGKIDIE